MRTITGTQYKVKITYFHFSSSIGVFLGNTAGWWMKDLKYCTYTVTWFQIQLESTVMAPVWQRTTGSSNSSGCEKYHTVNGHVHIVNNLLNSFVKMEHFLWNFWLDENFRCLVTRSLLYHSYILHHFRRIYYQECTDLTNETKLKFSTSALINRVLCNIPSEKEDSHNDDHNQEHNHHDNHCCNNSHLHVIIIAHNCCNEKIFKSNKHRMSKMCNIFICHIFHTFLIN